MFESEEDNGYLFESEVPVYHEDYIKNYLFTSELLPTIEVKTQAQKYHSITFCDPAIFDGQSYQTIGLNQKNTWDDWHLVPSSRPDFPPPKVRTNYLEIPGFNGFIDLTGAHSPYIYGEIEGSISFFVMNHYGYWADRRREIQNYIHGKRLFAILDDDPEWYYIGRWEFGGWEHNTDGICSSTTFNYHLQPEPYPVAEQNLLVGLRGGS